MSGKSLFINNFKLKKNRSESDNAFYKINDDLSKTTVTKSEEMDLFCSDELIIENNEKQIGPKFQVSSKHVLLSEQIVIHKELGKGEFGVVQQGVWTNDNDKKIQVAIKCLSKQQMHNNSMEFLKEAAIMHSVDHENIVRLYGVVLDASSLMIVTELAPLRSLLECLKEPGLRLNFSVNSLCDFAYQICNGMQYLEKKRLIHRDLAARNILVFATNLVKISDFGLSRALGVGKDYYQTNFNESLKLPIAWSAPECINYLKFTTSSDVWSYGVTLWEMFSYGSEPWATYTGKQILEAIDEPNYRRLDQPDCCPKDYYTLMLRCWDHNPNKRPKFSELINILPDCKPELVQTVKEWNFNVPVDLCKEKYFLLYNVSEILTVLDKNVKISGNSDENVVNYWKGALPNGKTGLFNPNNTVSYLGKNLPTCANISNGSGININNNNNNSTLSHFFKSILDKNSGNNNSTICSKKKLRPEMISRPKGDLKHTGHVGADGAFFGDISYLGEKYQSIPKQIVKPYKPQDDTLDKVSLSGNSSEFSDKTPLLYNKINDKKIFLDNKVNQKHSEYKQISLKKKTSADHEYHEINNDEDNCDNSKFMSIDLGPSLMDEVFKELNFDISSNINNLETDDSQSKEHKNNSNNLSLKKKQALVKPISASEQQSLDSAIAMVKELATKSLENFDEKTNIESLTLLENNSLASDSPKIINSPTKKKFTFKFKSNKEPKTFSDSITENHKNLTETIISEEAKNAYEKLIGSSSYSSSINSNSSENSVSLTCSNEKHKNYKSINNRLQSSVNRSLLPAPPPIPKVNPKNNNLKNLTLPNPLPLPPRDRTRPPPNLKHHERKHPLLMQDILSDNTDSLRISNLSLEKNNEPKQIMSTFKPNMPLHRNLSCTEPKPNISLMSTSPPVIYKTIQNSMISKDKNELNKQILLNDLPDSDNHNLNNGEKSQIPINSTAELLLNQNKNIIIDPSMLNEDDSDEVRLMQKVLANEVQISSSECVSVLKGTDWDIHKAIKCIRLREVLKSHSIILTCDWVKMLSKFNWNVRQASNYLIATQGLSEGTTEV